MPFLTPAEIDHLINGYTSNLGESVLEGTDSALTAMGVGEAKAAPGSPLSKNPLVGGFMDDGDFNSRSRSIQRLYRLAQKAEAIEEDASDWKYGDPEPPMSAAEIEIIKGAKKQFGAIQKEIREIYDLPFERMNPEKKRAALVKKAEQMIRISDRAFTAIDRIKTARANRLKPAQ
jgi:hypothetical protein